MEDDAPHQPAPAAAAVALTPLQRMMQAQQGGAGAHAPAAASSSSSAGAPLSPAQPRVKIQPSRRAPASAGSHSAAAGNNSAAAASSMPALASPLKAAVYPSLMGSSLLGPSSFSSSLASHPFLQQAATSPAAAPPTSAASSLAFARSPVAPSLAVPLSLAGTADAPRGKNKRTSDQFVLEQVTDPHATRLPAQPDHKPRGSDSDEDVEIGNARGVIGLSQDDEQEGMADETKAKPVEYAAKGGDDEDSSFMALLNKLATLELPNRGSEMEDCPICALKFTMADFAAHVYMCIKKLDPEDKRQQEERDAKFAVEMAFAEDNRGPRRRGLQPYGHRSITPEAVEAEEEQLLEKFASNKEEHCPRGKQCTRTDFKHFVLKWHPEVECPLCGAFFAVPEVNAHVTLCLDQPKDKTSPNKKTSGTDAMGDASMNGSSKPAGGIFSSAPVMIPSHAGLSAAAAAAAASGHAGVPARRSGGRKLGQRSMSASGMGSGSQQDDLLGSPPLDDDDDAEADDELDLDDAPAPPQRSSGGMLAPTSAAAAAASSSSSSGTGGPLHRSTSDCSLSLAQAAAVASLVLKKRGVGAPSGAVKPGEKDPSLLEMLNTFSSLGFTRENLEALHAQHQKEQDEKGGAGGM